MFPLLFALSTAQADEAPTRDHAVIFAPLALTVPGVRGQYRGALSDHTSYTVGAFAERCCYVSELAGAILAEVLPLPSVTQSSVGVEGGYTYHVKAVGSGWYVTGVGQVDWNRLVVEGLMDEKYLSFGVGAKVGYSTTGEGGLTFVVDAGPGLSVSRLSTEFELFTLLGIGYSF